MNKGQRVSMEVSGEWIDGITIENECASPIFANPERKVIRILWDDKSESIENVANLSPQPDLSFLNS